MFDQHFSHKGRVSIRLTYMFRARRRSFMLDMACKVLMLMINSHCSSPFSDIEDFGLELQPIEIPCQLSGDIALTTSR